MDLISQCAKHKYVIFSQCMGAITASKPINGAELTYRIITRQKAIRDKLGHYSTEGFRAHRCKWISIPCFLDWALLANRGEYYQEFDDEIVYCVMGAKTKSPWSTYPIKWNESVKTNYPKHAFTYITHKFGRLTLIRSFTVEDLQRLFGFTNKNPSRMSGEDKQIDGWVKNANRTDMLLHWNNLDYWVSDGGLWKRSCQRKELITDQLAPNCLQK